MTWRAGQFYVVKCKFKLKIYIYILVNMVPKLSTHLNNCTKAIHFLVCSKVQELEKQLSEKSEFDSFWFGNSVAGYFNEFAWLQRFHWTQVKLLAGGVLFLKPSEHFRRVLSEEFEMSHIWIVIVKISHVMMENF